MITMFAATIVAVSAALTPAFGTTYAGVEFNGERFSLNRTQLLKMVEFLYLSDLLLKSLVLQ